MGDLKARQDLNRSKSNSTRNQHDSARSALQRAELRHRRLSWVLVTAIAVAIGAAFGLAVWAGGLATVAWAAATGVIVGIVIGLGLAQIKGEAYAAQRVYVDAANALLREYEEDALVQAMSATVTVMRQDLATLKASVDAWALAFRAPGTESLVQRIKSAQGKGRRARAEADESKVRRQLWNDEYLDRKYKEYVGEVPETRQPRKVAQLMQQLTWMPVVWSANGTGSLPALQLGDGREVMADTPSVVASAMETSLRAWARTVFDGFESTVDIVSFAREVFPGANGLKAFAQVLHQGISGPRLRLSRVSSTIQRQTYDWIDLNFLRIPETQGVGLDGQLWVNALIQEITDITPGLSMNIVHAKSSDPHSCALVYGRYRIHLFHEVVEYKKGQEKYINYSSSQLTRATLHCFPAEVNASEYEQKLKPILRQAQRPFDNKIVRLLEHPFRIKLFIRALCLGLIRSRMIPDGAMSKFEFVLRRSLEGDAHLKLTSVSSTYPDIYAAMRQFACGAQSVDANAGTKVDPIDFNKVRDLTMAELERRVPGRGVGERRRRLEVLRDALEVYRDGVASDDGQPNQRQSSPLERDLQIPRRLKNGEDIQGAADMTRDLRDLLHLMIREEVDVLNAQIAGIADSD